MPKIIIKKKAEVLAEFALPEGNAAYHIGADRGNDLVVDDKSVSQQHVQIERRGAQYFVRDLKSAFGTFINGLKINAATEIRDGDTIGIGEHLLLFRHSANNYQAEREAQNHGAGGNLDFWQEVKEVVDIVPGEAAHTEPGLDSAEPSDTERLRRLQQQEDLDLSSLEQELAEVLEQAAQQPEAAPDHAPAAAEKSPYYLLAIDGPYLGKRFQLNFGETKVGRDGRLNDIIIRENRKGEIDPSISRRHATVFYRNNNFYLGDKRSKSRTYMNQDRLSASDELLLAPGDEIEIVSDRRSTIFRFVAEGNWDFSFPRKTGAWWLRYRAQALALGSIIFTLLGLCLAGYAWHHRAIAADVPAKLEMQYHLFAKAGAGGEAEAQTAGPAAHSASAPLPLALHLNKDAYTDLVFIHPEGTLSALSGKSRRRLWRYNNLILDRNYPAAAADINGNGRDDVVALTADGRMTAIDGMHGAEIWTSPFIAEELIGPPVIGNFDGEGQADVAVISVPGKMMVGYARLQEPEWVQIDAGVIAQAPLSCADLDGDGDEEILIGTERGLVLIYDGSDRRLGGSVNLNLSLNKLRGRFDESNQIRQPVSAADFNGDGRLDLLVSSRQGNLVCLDISTRGAGGALKTRELWWNNLATATDTLGDFSYPFVLGDVDADGLPDVLAADAQGTIFAFRGLGREGQKQPALWQAKGCPLVQLPALFDFDHDGRVEAVVAENNGWIKILSGKTGDVLWQEREAIVVPREAPLLADLSDKATVDILMVSADGAVHSFRSNRRVPSRTIIWGQRYGGPANLAASAVTKFPTQGWTVLLLISLLIVAAINVINFLIRQRRNRFAKS